MGMKHDGVVEGIEDAPRVTAQQPRVRGIEQLAEENRRVIPTCGSKERSAGKEAARADLRIDLKPALCQQRAQRRDPEPIRRLLEVRRDDQDALHLPARNQSITSRPDLPRWRKLMRIRGPEVLVRAAVPATSSLNRSGSSRRR